MSSSASVARLIYNLVIIFLLSAVSTLVIAGPPNWGATWQSMSINSKEAYITGMIDGVVGAYVHTASVLGGEKYEKNQNAQEFIKIRDTLLFRNTSGQLREVMTDLYRDPANAYIYWNSMMYLARDKIEGKNIASKLMEHRKAALVAHQLNEEERRK